MTLKISPKNWEVFFQLTSAKNDENIGKKILKPNFQYDEEEKLAKENYNKKNKKKKY